jgi:hypothetical protein
MQSADEDIDGMEARWLLEHAQVRAMARRQLSFSIPIVIAGAFVAMIGSFSVGHAVPPSSPPHHSPGASASRHVVV